VLFSVNLFDDHTGDYDFGLRKLIDGVWVAEENMAVQGVNVSQSSNLPKKDHYSVVHPNITPDD
jgi:hypothetical protein